MKPEDDASPGIAAGFLDHLEELRRRIFFALIGLVVGVVVAYFFSGRLLDLLTMPVEKMIFLSPPDAFVTRLKVALIAGLVLASPWMFYQFWRFVRPALLAREARTITLAVVFSTFFLLGGVAFALFVILPIGIRFLLSFESAKLEFLPSIDRYVTFVSHILLGAGLVFQLPVVVFFLARLGILTPKLLRKNRPIAVVLLVFIAALLTPPDVFTQLLLGVPLVILYELSIFGAVLAARARSRSQD